MKYFSIEELTRSERAKAEGINNTPLEVHKNNMVELIDNILDPLREAWTSFCVANRLGSPSIKVNSGYRSNELNKITPGASKTSAHNIGYAVDLVPVNGKMKEFKAFVTNWLKSRSFDQLIYEHPIGDIPSWIHIGYKNSAGEQRKMIFTIT